MQTNIFFISNQWTGEKRSAGLRQA